MFNSGISNKRSVNDLTKTQKSVITPDNIEALVQTAKGEFIKPPKKLKKASRKNSEKAEDILKYLQSNNPFEG